MNARTVSPRAGFSLIELLVSVVVMSFGLLSLAALQSTLFKSGAESRAQSVALSMASAKLEYFDGYRDRTEFQGFTDGNDSAVIVDGVSYTRSWTVDRRSEEHTSELQSLMRISYAVFCLKKKNIHKRTQYHSSIN